MYTKSILLLFSALVILSSLGTVDAHTIDSVEEYRLEIGWMTEPVVSGETNGIEIFVSPLQPNIPVEEQEFQNGISGLEDTLKLELIYKTEKIKLSLQEDHNVPGKYYAFVNPTVSGFYQANLLGEIHDTRVSLSMHPPKVDDRAFIEFPEPADAAHQQILSEHSSLTEELNEIKNTIKEIQSSDQNSEFTYVGIGLGIAGIAIGAVALSKRR